MKFKILLFFLSLFFVSSAIAEEKTTLVVCAKDGSKVAYALSEKPLVTFSETELIVKTKSLEVNYPFDKMARLIYGYEALDDKVDLLTDGQAMINKGDYLLFPELKSGDSVIIYSSNGVLVADKKIGADGEYVFPLNVVPIGIYMVKVNDVTYKIVKK